MTASERIAALPLPEPPFTPFVHPGIGSCYSRSDIELYGRALLATASAIAREDAQDAARYHRLVDWLTKQGLLNAQFCQPPNLPIGDYWLLRGVAIVKGDCEGFGKTEEEAIDAALATTTEGKT